MHFTFKNLFIMSLLILSIPTAALFAQNDQDLRIICWGRGNSLVLDALYMFPEAEESLIAIGSGSQAGGSFQQILDRNYEDKAVLEMELQPETVASFNPTHIVLKSYMRKAANNLERLGIPVIFMDMESPEQYEVDLDRLGKLFGNQERAEELKTYFTSERLEVVDIASKADCSPRVLFLYYSIKGGNTAMKVPPADWLQTRMVEWAGGTPVWTDCITAQNWQTVSFEQIASWNPDIIFLVSYHNNIDEVKKKITSDPLWRMLKSGKENRIYAVPGDYLSWDQPDPRWILGLNWVAEKLHPQLFPSQRLENKVYGFYNTAYGFSKEDVDEKIIPKINGDYR